MTGEKARIGESMMTEVISSMAVRREEEVVSEEPKERGGGTGSGWTNGLAQGCRIQKTRHFCDPGSKASGLLDCDT